MTDQTRPLRYRGWEPTTEGVELAFGTEQHVFEQDLSMVDVRELRDDLEEADLLSRGYEKFELDVCEIDKDDMLVLMGHRVLIKDVLSESMYSGEEAWVVQFELLGHSAVPCEVTLPGDLQVTVYRRAAG